VNDWRAYWNGPARVEGKDFLQQVGKTVNGRTVSAAVVDAIVDAIARNLHLQPDDRMLDLCCGNGLLTLRCAALCAEVTGVDFSAPLVAVANSHFAAPNIRYVEADVAQLPQWLLQQRFSKVSMYEGLQHLTRPQAEELLQALRRSVSADATVFLGSVPDQERLLDYYDTPARREEYQRRVKEGTEAIGHWWIRSDLAALLAQCGYHAEFIAPDPILHTAHYRFDVVCRPA
jgi:cyclopropane fatty-acyl-phospholipid synthase-like methyltransferase